MSEAVKESLEQREAGVAQRIEEIAGAVNTAGDVVRDLHFERPDDMAEQHIMAALDGAGELLEHVRDLRAALTRIAKREGPYSMDRLTHAENTIDAMARIAEEALAASVTGEE